MKTVQIDGVEVKYEIESLAYNGLFKFQIDGKKFEIFAEMLINGYIVYLKSGIEKFNITEHQQYLAKKIISSYLEDENSNLQFD